MTAIAGILPGLTLNEPLPTVRHSNVAHSYPPLGTGSNAGRINFPTRLDLSS